MSDEGMIWVKDKGNAFGTAYVPYAAHERLMIDKDQHLASLRARIEKLEGALRPFADESIWSGPQHEFVTVKRSDCDTARAALEERT